MGKNHPDLAWLSMPVQQWKKDPNYRVFFFFWPPPNFTKSQANYKFLYF